MDEISLHSLEEETLASESILSYNKWLLVFNNEDIEKELFIFVAKESRFQRRIIYVLLILITLAEAIRDIVLLSDKHPWIWILLFLWPYAPIIGMIDTFLAPERRPGVQRFGIVTVATLMLITENIDVFLVGVLEQDLVMAVVIVLVLVGLRVPFLGALVLMTIATPLYISLEYALSLSSAYVTPLYYAICAIFSVSMCFVYQRDSLHRFANAKQRDAERLRAEKLWKQQSEADQARAEAASQVKFLSTMSHELRTPLTSVIGACSLLIDDIEEKNRELVEIVFSGANATLDLVNNVLDFGKLRSGEVAIVEKPVNLRTLANAVYQVLKPLVDKKNISWKMTGTLQGTFALDEGRVKQILLNFGSNAVKFTPNGGSIEFGAEMVGDEKLRFSVHDNGPGIPEEKLEHIFVPFTQLGEQHGGSGLGLSISHDLAKLMNGRVWAESNHDSNHNHGTTFFFESFFARSDEISSPNSPMIVDDTPSSTSSGSACVLVAEDQPLSQRVICKMVQKAGYQALLTSNGVAAFSEYKERHESIFCILMDCQMPIMDGYDATRSIREFEMKHDIQATPIIALTAEALPHDKQKCLDCGMTGYITKPVTFAVLKQKLYTTSHQLLL